MLFDGLGGVYRYEIVFLGEFQILLMDAALEDFEAFVGIGGESHVHSGFVVLEFGASAEDTAKGCFEREFEKEGDVGFDGETVEVSEPLGVAAADGVAGEGGVDVTVGEDDVSGAEEGLNLALVAVGEVGAVDKGEGGGGEEERFLPLAGGLLDNDRGVPFGEEDFVAFEFEVAFEEVDLGGFARAVESFDSNENAGGEKFVAG